MFGFKRFGPKFSKTRVLHIALRIAFKMYVKVVWVKACSILVRNVGLPL